MVTKVPDNLVKCVKYKWWITVKAQKESRAFKCGHWKDNWNMTNLSGNSGNNMGFLMIKAYSTQQQESDRK